MTDPRYTTVLAVDDDAASLMLLDAVLTPLGFDVLLALSAGHAREIAAWEPPGLVLLDVMMPGESGIDACRAWRADPAWAEVPIIMLTAAQAHRAECLQAGADDFLEKPLDIDSLAEITNQWAVSPRAPISSMR
ncbi:DNA-binding response OmpR family regulator [Microbacterium endophyticum]|uniref:DNA-binding response OmpR family regulator n=2 Tax=Microbacterium TaxID=33882 RepID=A0A7W3PJZ0_9MICO|nr:MULTISPECIES: response regulator [Microbacterium]MBA8814995.1 DNA-binding response OmpR family regulator [Microbacterium halimionae]MBB2977069.1 DNA-binding response OmpR family regulator [Microbacterium endophyticum]NII94214.1 DNA-binding response OmpR family regulator [Microbacterium halimionae]NIK36137.1 DNA-binding response OmpR family regulator [Microbacterium endophyticum]